ncbi:MAG TPA: hypothetical protein DDX39_06555 [Bacteroidales bacterium]|nr:MAG: hypothetical protein A2W98_11405 [Bacteroidetes bacterium GWF2_33_38]OFY88377.1 MAG: hypothetical protein A2236_06940 [Bacteroidetes bacterium RIFOXYA2_FULL_33_7]HBF88287.1 hypothetical protein [Bacteroidales bacterium]
MLRCVIFFIVALLAVSCNSNKLNIGISEHYNLSPDEQEINITQKILSDYQNIYNTDSAQVPLNKVIKSKKYLLYISLALENNVDVLNQKLQNDSLTVNYLEKCTKNHCKVFFRNRNQRLFCYRYIYADGQNLYPMILTFSSQDSLDILNLYNNSEFINEKLK